MAGFPYVQAVGRLDAFFGKVRTVNRPPKATQAWLVGIGFASTNDRPVLGLMKELGYADSGGNTTALWDELRGSDAVRRASLGRQMRVGYPDIFAQYPDDYIASSLTKDELKNFIRPRVSAGTVNLIVATFFALRLLATFDAAGSGESPASAVVAAAGESHRRSGPSPTTPVNVTINLSLELPPTTDGDVYDKLFESMAKHLGTLLGRGS